jgi:hypothetical protein
MKSEKHSGAVTMVVSAVNTLKRELGSLFSERISAMNMSGESIKKTLQKWRPQSLFETILCTSLGWS